MIACFLAVLWAGALPAQSPSPVTGPAEIYFLSVGMANPQEETLPQITAARDSATVVANALLEAGARYGILLTSDPEAGTMVSRDDVLAALRDLKRRIRADDAQSARIVVYIMSHGFGDPASTSAYLVPDNLDLNRDTLNQIYTYRLVRRSLWNIDILAALLAFRLDARLAHLDELESSAYFSDRLGMAGILETAENQQNLDERLSAVRQTYGSKPLRNAPIPFMVLFDNCNFGVEMNLFEPNMFLRLLTRVQYSATLDIGRAYFAAPPGESAAPVALPTALASEADLVAAPGGRRVPPNVGPLAVHLKNVLAETAAQRPMSLSALDAAMLSSGVGADLGEMPTPLFSPEVLLRGDVAMVDFLPVPGGPRGTLERRAPSGRAIVACCDGPMQ